MYSTVIDRHPTVIRHQVPQPTTVGMQTDAAKAFAINADPLSENRAESLAKGAYSIPVKIESGATNDPTLSSYETPNFIHKKESILNANSGLQSGFGIDPEVYLKSKFQEDLGNVVANLDKAKMKEEKIAVCNFFIFFFCPSVFLLFLYSFYLLMLKKIYFFLIYLRIL